MIRAEVHTDDYAYTAKFDAEPWFEQATLNEIVDLARCGWGGDYPADYVASFHKDISGYRGVQDVLADAAIRKPGFECHVHDDDALIWLWKHRPEFVAPLAAALGLEAEDLKRDSARSPHWDADCSWMGEYQSAGSVNKTKMR